MKSIIVAYDKNFGIGAKNDLLWKRDLPADLRHFKTLTTGHAIIMGSKTYQSIGRVLPDRQNIVISRQALFAEGAVVVSSLAQAYASVEDGRETFVIGGGEIFRLAIDTVDRLYVTEVNSLFEADVFFPRISAHTWREVSREHHQKDERNLYDYDFVVYDRA